MKAKVIYSRVASYKDSLEAVIYQEKINQLDTFIRLCCMNLKMASSEQQEKKVNDSLSGKIDKAHLETRAEKIENIEEVVYNGKSIPLKSDRLKQVFKRIEI